MPANHTDYEYYAEGLRINVLSGTAPKLPHRELAPTLVDFHTHFWHELFFARHNDMLLHTPTGNVIIPVGHFVLVHPNAVHYMEKIGDNFACSFSVRPATAKPSDHAMLHLLEQNAVQLFKADTTCTMLATLLEEACRLDDGTEACNYLFGFLLHVCKLQAANTPTLSGDSDILRIYKIDSLLLQYALGDLSLTDMAQTLNLSSRQLSRIIKKQYGCSFRDKITQLRMQEAERLLRGGTTVAQTAAETGYASLRGFYSAFISIYGISPGEYRKKHTK